jgi:hypothetical protein
MRRGNPLIYSATRDGGIAAHGAGAVGMPVVGFLAVGSLDTRGKAFVAAFHRGLAEIGYFERQNVAIDYGRTKRIAPASIHGQTYRFITSWLQV